MRLPTTQKLIVEDFENDQQEWIGKLIGPINDFVSNVLKVVNGGLDFANFTGLEKELDFVYVDDATTFPLSIMWGLSKRPKALSLVAAYENDPTENRDFSPVIIALAWNFSTQIEITSAVKLTSSGVATLDADKRYRILVRVT